MDPVTLSSSRDRFSPAVRRTEGTGRKASGDEMKLRKACGDFESLLLYSLLKTMRRTIPQGSLSGKNPYDMMMDQKLAEEISGKGRGIGLQDMLYEQLKGQLKKK